MVSSLPLSIPQPASALQYDILFREPDDSLPEPLPSVETIEDARINDSYAARSIACVGTSYFVKYGYGVEPLEAENMKFVRQYTSIHVPRVYAVYRRSIREGGQKTYIIMEKIEGESLEKLWDEFDSAQKLSITRQLKESFISLRDLPHHGYFGSLDKTKLRDFLFAADEPMPSIDAPFDTEEALLDGLMDRFLAEDPDRLRHKASYYRLVLPQAFKGDNQPVFTHGDLQPKNIMLQPDGCIAIVDWATSGWYPVYWEYAIAVCTHRGWSNDWPAHIGLFLDEYPNHFAWMSRLRMDRWY
ncbi:phosphotransferase enzyme family [Cordyceps militaris]|uniref:Phosphotransferase enzyme family n=1 Tax=Cordyceps militaris TaxID=73501 RepID=A0A2H4SKW1_CORMI|nr:phosphotransferase enzyme family [Cordyceps militaris]